MSFYTFLSTRLITKVNFVVLISSAHIPKSLSIFINSQNYFYSYLMYYYFIDLLFMYYCYLISLESNLCYL